MREQWNFASAGQLIFGPHAVDRVGQMARRLGLRRALIVSDEVLARIGIVDQVRQPLKEAGIEVGLFAGGEPDPSTTTVDGCVEAARAGTFDALVAVGGGSNIDTAKTAATILTHGGEVSDYFGVDRVPGPLMPLIAVATTAGTGSEVTAGSVITDVSVDVKKAILSPYMRPSVAICDPLLTMSCPAKVTADSGIDALTHAIGAFTCIDYRFLPAVEEPIPVYPGKSPLTDSLALQAIELIGRNLRLAVYQPENLQAREGMSLAAMVAGLAFSNAGLVIVHSLQYAVATRVHNSHGEGNGMLLPYVMQYNLPARPELFATIARLLGERVEGLTPIEAAAKSVDAVQRLKSDIGIPMRLRDVGVQESDIPAMAQQAIAVGRLLELNPRPLRLQDMEGILRAAY